ncbi:MAG: aminoacetone oxidase family FAD-binding enzyme [Acutalibacteraceae bacterium]|nr:aminoacetone oxidase family FAD-binding enzyme [Acutalibacteraceae bacterium]
MKNDVIIIGGGAAGLCAAVAIKKNNPALSVRLLEALPRVGKKLAATGNGRCNITNKNIVKERYHGKDTDFAMFALSRFRGKKTEDFFHSIGVDFIFEEDKGYPASLQAASVVDCLRFAAEEAGVIICTEAKVTNIQISRGLYKIIAEKMSFLAENVIIAAGLLSGGDKLGNDGQMLELMKKAGFNTIKTHPAIVQLKTEPEIVRQLKGIKVNAEVSLKSNGKLLRREYGEVLFCDYGLSGPPILQVSGMTSKTQTPVISLDLMPEKSIEALTNEIRERISILSRRTTDEFFTGIMNKRLGQVIIKSAGYSLNTPVSSLDNNAAENIAELIKDFSFKVTGNTGFINSQVTSGGLDTNQFDPKTMMSRDCKGLYAIGEILDIDGDCGGFNLQWAWSSALCAAESITTK